jgi:hypothetical protein
MRAFVMPHLLLPFLLVPIWLPADVQPAQVPFKPGQWEIDSVTTVAHGRTISSQTTLCATAQQDFWKVPQAGMDCKPPKVLPAGPGTYRVIVVCKLTEGQLTSDIRSEVIEKLAANGESFTVHGTTTTDTVFQGVAPTHTIAQLNATAHRTGSCH